MGRVLIGIQGGEGSFSEQAAKKFILENKIKKYEIKYLISSIEVLFSLRKLPIIALLWGDHTNFFLTLLISANVISGSPGLFGIFTFFPLRSFTI